ncbi:MAG TPA: alkaline phosphatase family protein [Gemmatimonadales bacterium]|nr:alkaline phosphatase family protein [Gemmatimonadales bacterium]
MRPIRPRQFCAAPLMALVSLAALTAACNNDDTGPALLRPVAQLVRCQADVRGLSLSCGGATAASPSAPEAAGVSGDLIVGGQGTFLQLSSSHVTYNASTGIFAADVTVQNLMALVLGTPDGSAVTGVKVFFYSGPAVDSGSGTVTVANADGIGTFTAVNQPYFLYDQILGEGQVSGAKTWQWNVPATVGQFVFEVLVDAAAPGGGTPVFGHVALVTLENSGYASVIGNASMPYFNGLAAQYGLATQYYADTHPSIGNYFELMTGQVLTNDDGSSAVENVPNIVRSLVSAGKAWKSYAESLPNACYIGPDTGLYVRRHNVIALLSDVANDPSGEACNIVPFSQFATDLANGTLPAFANIVPNLCDDAHSCSLATADAWLQTNIDPLIKSPTFQNDGLLVIVFDESVVADTTNGGGRVAWVAVSPRSRLGHLSTTLYQHQSTLRLLLEGLGIYGLPGAAATAPDMSEFFTP